MASPESRRRCGASLGCRATATAAGRYRWFIDRQRRIHTFAGNPRGPASRLPFLGHPITDIVALSSATGNVRVAVAVLSYAGRLTITLVADPDTCPDVSALTDLVQEEIRISIADESPRENS